MNHAAEKEDVVSVFYITEKTENFLVVFFQKIKKELTTEV